MGLFHFLKPTVLTQFWFSGGPIDRGSSPTQVKKRVRKKSARDSQQVTKFGQTVRKCPQKVQTDGSRSIFTFVRSYWNPKESSPRPSRKVSGCRKIFNFVSESPIAAGMLKIKDNNKKQNKRHFCQQRFGLSFVFVFYYSKVRWSLPEYLVFFHQKVSFIFFRPVFYVFWRDNIKDRII